MSDEEKALFHAAASEILRVTKSEPSLDDPRKLAVDLADALQQRLEQAVKLAF